MLEHSLIKLPLITEMSEDLVVRNRLVVLNLELFEYVEQLLHWYATQASQSSCRNEVLRN
jgi:hypothetical protein